MMKFNIFTIWSITVLVTVTSVSAQEQFVLSSFPFNSIAQTCQPIMQQAYEKIGIEIAIQQYPPARGLSLANDGHTDGDLCRGSSQKERFSNLIQVPVPLTYVEIVVFSKDVEFPVEGWDSLKPYRIGLQRGFKLGEAKTQGMTVYTAETSQIFRMLDAGRVDVVVIVKLTGISEIKDLRLKGIHILGPPLEQIPMYHYLHKKHEHIVPKLTTILEEMQQAGEFERIKEDVENRITE